MVEEAISVSIKLFEGTREQASEKKYQGIDRQNRQYFVWVCDSERDRAHNCRTKSWFKSTKRIAALMGGNLPYLYLTLDLDVWIVRFRLMYGFTAIEIPPEQQTAYN
jgi:hypothetical protein